MEKITKYTKVLLMFTVLAACSDPFSKEIKPDNGNRAIPTNDKEIKFSGDFLEFSSQKVFDETLASLRNQSREDILEWGKHFGFTSMREVYENAMTEQREYRNKLIDQYKSYSETDPRKREKPTVKQPPLAMKYAALFNFDESGMISGLKTFHFDIASVLNKDGIVMISGNIFQYNQTNIKIIEGRDRSKIAKLSSIEKTDEKQRIFVTPVTSKFTKVSPSGRYEYSSSLSSVGDFGVHTYYSLAIHTYYTAVYGPMVCDCTNPVPSNARIEPSCTNCYSPIIGYDARTVYTTQMQEKHDGFLGIWTCYTPPTSWMQGLWTGNGVGYRFNFSVSDVSDWTRTIYDGPLMNISYGNHQYSWWNATCGWSGNWVMGSAPSGCYGALLGNSFRD